MTTPSFPVPYTRLLDPDGRPTGDLPGWADDRETLVSMYRAMVLTRTFDAKAVALQRTGRLGTYASSLGQEAVGVGVATAMRPADVFLPSFREPGTQLVRGVTLVELLLYWGGDERGSDFAGPREDFPICVPVGSHAPHAAGVALAFALRREPRVAVCVFGDGATSKGDVYEAMNFAGVRGLPVVFVVANNEWAISLPRSRQTAAATLAQKAVAAGIDCEQVDGNDVLAVREVVGRTVEAARNGHGPTLVEALTYRLGDHTTADDATRYRDDAEVTTRWHEEPILRLRRHLTDRGWWDVPAEEVLLAECAHDVEAAADEYEATPPLPPSAMFEHLYAVLPDALRPQLDQVVRASAGVTGEGSGG